MDELLKYFAAISAFSTAIVFIAKHIIDTSTKAVLEKYKNELKIEFEKEKSVLKQEYEKYDRQREELKKWANPVLAAVNGLAGRLNYIVTDNGYQELEKHHPQFNYYFPSTLYYFAQYLCWIQILKEEINYEIFSEKAEEVNFFKSLRDVNVSLRNVNSPAPIFSLQQRQIAEIMRSDVDEKRKCITYHEFVIKHKEDGTFKDILKPLEELVEKIAGPDQYTNTILKEVLDLKEQCQGLLKS